MSAKRWVWVVEKWDTTSGRRLAFPLQPIETVFPFGNLLVSADGGTLCVQTEDKLIGVDAISGKRKYAIGSGGGVVSASPDGRTAALVARPIIGPPPEATTVAFWKFEDGTNERALTVPGPVDMPCASAFSRDSRFFAVATAKGRISLINVRKVVVRSSYVVNGSVKGLCLLNSGEIAALGTEPKAIVVWKIKPP